MFALDVIGSEFPITQGGGFTISFDPLVLEITSVSIDGVVWNFVNDTGTTDNVAGTLTDVLVSAFPGVATGSFTVATVEFLAKGTGISGLGLAPSSNVWASGGLPVNPTFDSGLVTVVPLPAAVWLFVSGFMVLARRMRRA